MPARSIVGIDPLTGSPESSAYRTCVIAGIVFSGSGPKSTSATITTRQPRKNQIAAASVPKSCSRPAATNGPMKMPSRKLPPSSDSERARNSIGTRVVMNACRARPKAAAHMPSRKTDAASTSSDGASTIPTAARIAMTPAITIVYRSPMRPTAQPAGRLPHS